MRVLDVTECWEIPQSGDPGYNPQATRWFVWDYPRRVDIRPNEALDDFFAQPLPPPVKVVEGDMRKNDLLDAIFG